MHKATIDCYGQFHLHVMCDLGANMGSRYVETRGYVEVNLATMLIYNVKI
jgi:hypothetical protein